MKNYIFGKLVKGEQADNKDLNLEAIQAGHLQHIKKMVDEGILLLAGPFIEPEGEEKGIYIFNSDSIERVKELALEDPAVKAGRLKIEFSQIMFPAGTEIKLGSIC